MRCLVILAVLCAVLLLVANGTWTRATHEASVHRAPEAARAARVEARSGASSILDGRIKVLEARTPPDLSSKMTDVRTRLDRLREAVQQLHSRCTALHNLLGGNATLSSFQDLARNARESHAALFAREGSLAELWVRLIERERRLGDVIGLGMRNTRWDSSVLLVFGTCLDVAQCGAPRDDQGITHLVMLRGYEVTVYADVNLSGASTTCTHRRNNSRAVGAFDVHSKLGEGRQGYSYVVRWVD